MREAGQRDDGDVVEPAHHGDTEKVSAVPFFSLGFASPRMPAPLADAGVDVDMDLEGDGDDRDGDEEGETQVDAQRSADALQQMRALETTAAGGAPPPAAEASPGPSATRGRGLPPGRPAVASVPPVLVAPRALSTVSERADVSTLKFPPAALPTAVRPDQFSSPDRPEHLFTSSPLQFGSPARAPTGYAMPVAARGVGRRTGILIAISTAAAVALIAGAWTATRPEEIPPVASAGTVTSRLTAAVPHGTAPVPPAPPPIAAVVVATPPSPEPAAGTDLAPSEEPPASPPANTAPTPSGTVPARTASAPAAPARGTAMSKRAAAAAAKKARLARKAQAAANKRRLRAQNAAVKADPFAPERPNARPAPPSRSVRGDADDTLPPSD